MEHFKSEKQSEEVFFRIAGNTYAVTVVTNYQNTEAVQQRF